MAIELIRRPLGHKISLLPVSAVIVDNGAGDAVVYVEGGHSLSDGDYVYIESNFDSYNGYKYVDATSYDYFKIQNSENSDPIEYVQDADISLYVSLLNHGWQGVHTPIVYELKSDIFPINQSEEEYNPNVVDSFSSYGGNTQLNLDHSLSNPTELTWIELVGVGELAGTYQVLAVIQPWSIVIDLAYDATYDFTGYVVVKHYKNYCINVNIYAGYESGHRWESRKPFELASTLKLIPDADGVKFSIHEILRGYMDIRNNLTLDTLPNNTDFHISFYIGYSESYDDSDGSEITTFTSSETIDTFVGHAVNAMMPFKSLSECFMSDYVDGGGELAQWLTLFDRPVAVVGYFFDISFINQYDGVDIIILRNGELFQTITNPGSGIIRVMFIPESGYTEYCIQAQVPTFNALADHPLSSWTQVAGVDQDWTLGVAPFVTLAGLQGSDVLQSSISGLFAGTHDIQYDVGRSNTTGSAILNIRFYKNSVDVGNVTGININSSSNVGTESVILTDVPDQITITVAHLSPVGTSIYTIGSMAMTTEGFEITEQICIDIVEECGSTFNNELRITDGDQLRRV